MTDKGVLHHIDQLLPGQNDHFEIDRSHTHAHLEMEGLGGQKIKLPYIEIGEPEDYLD